MPFLTYPLALLGLASLPGLVAIYFLRRRFQRREVAALFLWSALARAEQGGRRMERFRTPLLFFVELLALACLALAATDLRHLSSRAVRPLVLVLDDSYSMRAEAGGESARTRGLEAVRRELDRQRPTSVRVVLAGAEPQSLGVPLPASRALALVAAGWHCIAPAADLSAALALATELGEPSARILVVTDHPPEDARELPGQVWLAVGRQETNVAFAAAGRNRLDGRLDRCFVQVANPGSLRAESRLTVLGDGAVLGDERPLSLPPGASERIAFTIPGSVQSLRIRLSADALALDNEVVLLPPRERRVRVANRIRDAALREDVARALAATGLSARDPGAPELVVADGPPGAPSRMRWTLEIRIPKTPVPFTGPFVADWGHRLMQGLDFSGVVWSGERDAGAEGQPVLMAGNTPLVEDRETGGGHALRMHLGTGASTLARTPNWPALFWNLLSWRADFRPGFAEELVRMGQVVTLLAPAVGTDGTPPGEAEVTDPEGKIQRLAIPPGGRLSVAGAIPGVYSAAVGGETYRFACNPLSPAEGDLSACRPARVGGRPDGQALRRHYASGAWLLGLAAMALLLLHTFLLRLRPLPAASRT